jgi:hypothetical protein
MLYKLIRTTIIVVAAIFIVGTMNAQAPPPPQSQIGVVEIILVLLIQILIFAVAIILIGWIGLGIRKLWFLIETDYANSGGGCLFWLLFPISLFFLILYWAPMESIQDWKESTGRGRILNKKKTSRYIRTSKSIYCYYVKLNVIIFFTVIGAIMGLFCLFFDACLIFNHPIICAIDEVSEVFAFFAFTLLGYLTPFIWIGIKAWFSRISDWNCLLSIIVLFLPHVIIPVISIYYAFKGIIAIIRRDFEEIDPRDLSSEQGTVDGCDDPRWY